FGCRGRPCRRCLGPGLGMGCGPGNGRAWVEVETSWACGDVGGSTVLYCSADPTEVVLETTQGDTENHFGGLCRAVQHGAASHIPAGPGCFHLNPRPAVTRAAAHPKPRTEASSTRPATATETVSPAVASLAMS